MFRSRSHLQAVALWLALAGVVLRGLVPVGFMPGWTGTDTRNDAAAWLIICPTSPLHGAFVAPAAAPAVAGHHDHAAMLAAMAAAAADPHAHHHHGPQAAIAAAADAAAEPAAAADPHAGHAAGEHGGHRIAAEHLSCPFAGAATAALPVAAAVFAADFAGASAPIPARSADAVPTVRRRLPPARAPPPHDDHAVA